MNLLCTRYTMYFNKKYQRVGKLYQGVYKAVQVKSDEQLLYLTSYIHNNPVADQPNSDQGVALISYSNYFSKPSSYGDYLNKNTEWINTEDVLSFFSKSSPSLSYQEFVEKQEYENLSLSLDI